MKDESPSEASTNNILANSSRANVTLVDLYGRPRRFEEDGTEVALPPVDAPSTTVKTSPPRQSRNTSVRVVDSLGNEIQQQSMMTEVTEEIEGSTFDVEGADRRAVVQRMSREITELAKQLEETRLRCVRVYPHISSADID